MYLKKFDTVIDETQFEFWNSIGSRVILLTSNLLVQIYLDINKKLSVRFLEYNKAFDKHRHNHLCQFTKDKNTDTENIRFDGYLYFYKKATDKRKRRGDT